MKGFEADIFLINQHLTGSCGRHRCVNLDVKGWCQSVSASLSLSRLQQIHSSMLTPPIQAVRFYMFCYIFDRLSLPITFQAQVQFAFFAASVQEK